MQTLQSHLAAFLKFTIDTAKSFAIWIMHTLHNRCIEKKLKLSLHRNNYKQTQRTRGNTLVQIYHNQMFWNSLSARINKAAQTLHINMFGSYRATDQIFDNEKKKTKTADPFRCKAQLDCGPMKHVGWPRTVQSTTMIGT